MPEITKNTEQNNASKFSFIKSKKSEVPVNTNATTSIYLFNLDLNINDLSNELNKVFNESTIQTNNSIFNQVNNIQTNPIFNQVITNPNFNQVPQNNHYVPNNKHYPANFDMLFDSSLLTQGPSLLEGNPKSTEDQNGPTDKKSLQDHNFDFVSAMMRPKK